jgi:hypothetical protein
MRLTIAALKDVVVTFFAQCAAEGTHIGIQLALENQAALTREEIARLVTERLAAKQDEPKGNGSEPKLGSEQPRALPRPEEGSGNNPGNNHGHHHFRRKRGRPRKERPDTPPEPEIPLPE